MSFIALILITIPFLTAEMMPLSSFGLMYNQPFVSAECEAVPPLWQATQHRGPLQAARDGRSLQAARRSPSLSFTTTKRFIPGAMGLAMLAPHAMLTMTCDEIIRDQNFVCEMSEKQSTWLLFYLIYQLMVPQAIVSPTCHQTDASASPSTP